MIGLKVLILFSHYKMKNNHILYISISGTGIDYQFQNLANLIIGEKEKIMQIDVSNFTAKEARELTEMADRVEKEKCAIIGLIIRAARENKQIVEIKKPQFDRMVFYLLQELGYKIDKNTNAATGDAETYIISWRDENVKAKTPLTPQVNPFNHDENIKSNVYQSERNYSDIINEQLKHYNGPIPSVHFGGK